MEKNVVIHFQDNGIGVEKKYLGHIFDMFYRATELSTGSGLGLYVVKETVEKLKEHIAVSSVYGKGTDFIVEIPAFSSKRENKDMKNTPV